MYSQSDSRLIIRNRRKVHGDEDNGTPPREERDGGQYKSRRKNVGVTRSVFRFLKSSDTDRGAFLMVLILFPLFFTLWVDRSWNGERQAIIFSKRETIMFEWKDRGHFRRRFRKKKLKKMKEDDDDSDYNGLYIYPLKDFENGRQISDNNEEETDGKMVGHTFGYTFGYKVYVSNDHVDTYYAFDDDFLRDSKCRYPSWHNMLHPNCNSFHESDLESIQFVGKGAYRDAWFVPNPVEHEKVILKTLLSSINTTDASEYYEYYESIRMDALVMERLTSSPRIVDIYGHCGTSVITEALAHEFESIVVPGWGMIKKDEEPPLESKNVLLPTEKLEFALAMAESLADLHGYKYGVIVHDDVQLCQWLFTKDMFLKLNDFNRAEVMLWDEENQEYCKYQNGKVYGNYRAPEEDGDLLLDEKIDVYSFGNNIYGMLTGLWVYYDTDDDGAVQKKVIKGEAPYIDQRYRNGSFAESELVKVMELCWRKNPSARPDIFEVVKLLKSAMEEGMRMGSLDSYIGYSK